MKKTTPAANPDAYVAALDGWRRERVEALRATVERREGMTVKPATVRRLTKEAVALNHALGDPTLST